MLDFFVRDIKHVLLFLEENFQLSTDLKFSRVTKLVSLAIDLGT